MQPDFIRDSLERQREIQERISTPERTTVDPRSLDPVDVIAAVMEAKVQTTQKGYYGPFLVSVPYDLDLEQQYGPVPGLSLRDRLRMIADVDKVVKNYHTRRTVTVAQMRGTVCEFVVVTDRGSNERPMNLIPNESRTIEYNGMKVDEFKIEVDNSENVQLVWVKHGCINVLVDEKGDPCPVFHSIYKKSDDPKKIVERTTRRRIAQLFHTYYFPKQPMILLDPGSL